jgi:hypothetical protein
MVLYWFPKKPRSLSMPSVLAFPRFPLSSALKRYMTASMGRMRRSNFHVSAFSCSYVGRWCVVPSIGMGPLASLEEESDSVTSRPSFATSGSLVVDMLATCCPGRIRSFRDPMMLSGSDALRCVLDKIRLDVKELIESSLTFYRKQSIDKRSDVAVEIDTLAKTLPSTCARRVRKRGHGSILHVAHLGMQPS